MHTTCIYVCTYVYYTYIHTHMYNYTYIHTYTHTHIHTHLYTYIHTYIHRYIHTCNSINSSLIELLEVGCHVCLTSSIVIMLTLRRQSMVNEIVQLLPHTTCSLTSMYISTLSTVYIQS